MHVSHTTPRRGRGGFTLTEMLVVIAIIAILVSITSVGVMTALSKAKATRIKTELDQIDTALKAYKEKYGSYPPCDLRDPASNAALRQHVAQAFPRYRLGNLANDLGQTGLDLTNFRPDQALYFWLRGFSSDPSNPFISLRNEQISGGAIPNPGVSITVAPLFEFDTTRLAAVDASGVDQPVTTSMPSYFPQGSQLGTAGAPYVYWDARSYPEDPDKTAAEYKQPKFFFNSSAPTKGSRIFYTNAGILIPYWLDSNGDNVADTPPAEDWANPDSFQLLAAGIDFKYGTETPPALTDQARLYPTGTRYDIKGADEDNASNFITKARIGDDRP